MLIANETRLEWLIRHKDHEGSECLIWPFCIDNHGYGQLGVGGGKSMKAHKKMCEIVHGSRPTPAHQASHSCNKGHLACVHPKHVSWETRRENHLRRKANGTAATNKWGKHGKVTVEIAKQILMLRNVETQETIARRFDVSKPTVRNIYKGKSRVAKEAHRLLAA